MQSVFSPSSPRFSGALDAWSIGLRALDDWDDLLVPEIERQQAVGTRVAFRADAAFAKPEIYEALEQRDVDYAIRMPANKTLELEIEDILFRPPGRPSRTPVVRYIGRRVGLYQLRRALGSRTAKGCRSLSEDVSSDSGNRRRRRVARWRDGGLMLLMPQAFGALIQLPMKLVKVTTALRLSTLATINWNRTLTLSSGGIFAKVIPSLKALRISLLVLTKSLWPVALAIGAVWAAWKVGNIESVKNKIAEWTLRLQGFSKAEAKAAVSATAAAVAARDQAEATQSAIDPTDDLAEALRAVEQAATPVQTAIIETTVAVDEATESAADYKAMLEDMASAEAALLVQQPKLKLSYEDISIGSSKTHFRWASGQTGHIRRRPTTIQ